MNNHQLADCLIAFASSQPKGQSRAALEAFANVVAAGKKRPAAAVLVEIDARLATAMRNSKPNRGNDLSRILRPLADIASSCGTKAAARVIHQLLNICDAYKDVSLKSYLSMLQNGESAKVERYVARLRDAYRENADFAAVLADLKGDKSVTPEQMSEIASMFTDARKKRSRKDAIAAIEKWHQSYVGAAKSRSAAGNKSAA